MRLRQLAKDAESGRANCPSVHLDEDSGRLVVVGAGVDLAHVPDPQPGEQAVSLKAEIVRDAARALGWL